MVFIVKGWLLVFVMMWVRWTLPRLRIDQVMTTCMKYLVPISCFLLLGVALWQVAMPNVVLKNLKYGLSGLCVVVVVWLLLEAGGRAEQATQQVVVVGRPVASNMPGPNQRAVMGLIGLVRSLAATY